ncbi:hypothetical protein FB45DRAFT_478165 [Roridomyces roridus]|uniref:DUF6533 domain-containing protein n=1 Tax=Roridomyces roridus TaxID=1738132 RepID=A0AAD7FRE4_9AGAR|nr:hypothetical protein FB45DRAFT_478165 [Roridomyces roridus]
MEAAANAMRWQNRLDRCANVSALSLLAWDYCQTFTQEVEYFWFSKWSLVKLLFFINRYLTFGLVILSVLFDLYPTPDKATYASHGPSLKFFLVCFHYSSVFTSDYGLSSVLRLHRRRSVLPTLNYS